MALYIVSSTAPIVRECEIVADNLTAAIEIAASELVKMLAETESED